MKPLNDDDSKRLFYKRLGFEENDYPQEFKLVSDEILKKCDGLPLAIITVASILAMQPTKIKEWELLYYSDRLSRDLDRVHDRSKT